MEREGQETKMGALQCEIKKSHPGAWEEASLSLLLPPALLNSRCDSEPGTFSLCRKMEWCSGNESTLGYFFTSWLVLEGRDECWKQRALFPLLRCSSLTPALPCQALHLITVLSGMLEREGAHTRL